MLSGELPTFELCSCRYGTRAAHVTHRLRAVSCSRKVLGLIGLRWGLAAQSRCADHRKQSYDNRGSSIHRSKKKSWEVLSAGRPINQFARELGLSHETLWNWVRAQSCCPGGM
ncbi:transposase [Saccharopolyspora sp. NPDC003762]